MTSPDRSPITPEDICAQVVAMGGKATEAITTLAGTFARKLSEEGVQRNADGRIVDDSDLAKAARATEALLMFQLQTVSLLKGVEPRERIDEPTELNTEGARAAAIGVQAAIARLLGDMDDPNIRTFELLNRH